MGAWASKHGSLPAEPIEALVTEQLVLALQAPHITQMVGEGLHHSTVNELLRLTLLEPAIVQAIYAGQQTRCMSLLWFQRNPLPVDWVAQREVVARFDA